MTKQVVYVKPQFDDPSKKPSRCDWHSGQIQKTQSGLYKPYRVCIKFTSPFTYALMGKARTNWVACKTQNRPKK